MTGAPDTRSAFARAFTDLYPGVRAFTARRVGEADAEDLAVETFEIAWTKRGHDPASVDAAWLFGIARKLCANHLNRRRRFDRAIDRLSSERSVEEEPSLTNDDGRLGVLAALGIRDKEILVLAAWEELSVSEIARVLGCSRANAAVRLHRARKRASALLGGLAPDVSQPEECAR